MRQKAETHSDEDLSDHHSSSRKRPGSRPKSTTLASDNDSNGDAEDSDDGDGEDTQYEIVEHPSFQPGSTKVGNKRRFLAWNMTGLILYRDEHTQASIDIEFHDRSSFKPVHMTDHFKYSMAALGEKGALFATELRGQSSPSSIYFKPMGNWASNSDWTLRLDGDESVLAIALGSKWAAAATSRNFVRLFTTSGLQRGIFSLPGAIVAMAGHEALLLLVYNQAPPMLGYMLYHVDEKRMVASGSLPISPGSQLTWLGFSESGVPATCDTAGLLRALLLDQDNLWSPILDAAAHRKNADEVCWIVGLTDDEVVYVLCKGGETYPQTLPRPVTSTLALQVPLMHLDTPFGLLEEKLLRTRGLLNLKRKLISWEITMPEFDETRLETEAEAAVLKLIEVCLFVVAS